jgi:hypothetical protein
MFVAPMRFLQDDLPARQLRIVEVQSAQSSVGSRKVSTPQLRQTSTRK